MGGLGGDSGRFSTGYFWALCRPKEVLGTAAGKFYLHFGSSANWGSASLGFPEPIEQEPARNGVDLMRGFHISPTLAVVVVQQFCW